ncbi:unnamed protein product [Blepharisma stoltei]|uniref:Uncharacterized protein n=1 Tax=Blepharisma stoltei TaxID=1481888 RepID=A0AAU9JWR0_9CILI|nr:unnamed protein product [Blepharisma stoltei]
MEIKDFHFPPIGSLSNYNDSASRFETHRRVSNFSEMKVELTERECRLKRSQSRLNASHSVERVDFHAKKPIYDEIKQALLRNREISLSIKNNDSSRKEDYLRKSLERAKNDAMVNVAAAYNEAGKDLSVKVLNQVLKSVEILLKDQAKFQNEADIIHKVLKKSIFIEKEEINAEIMDHLYDDNKNLIFSSDRTIPYFILLKSLSENFLKMKAKYEKNKEIICNRTEELVKEIEGKEIKIKELNENIEDLKESKEKSDQEKADLMNKYKRLEEDLKFYIKVSSDRENMVQKVQRNNNDGKEIIKDLEWQIKKSELDYDYFYSEYRKLDKEHNELKLKYNNMMLSYPNMIVKLKQLHEGNEELEKRISGLEAENSELHFKTSVIDDLTPRPDLDKIISLLHIKNPPERTISKANTITIELRKAKNKKLREKIMQENIETSLNPNQSETSSPDASPLV